MSSISRREFFRLAGLVASSTALAGCAPAYRALGGPIETHLPPGDAVLSSQIFAGLNRLTFGPRRSEQIYVREIGLPGWIEEQLAPEAIDDGPLDWRLRPYEILNQSADDLYTRGERLFDGFDSKPIIEDLAAVTLLRQVYSRRQLYEVMVNFWTDHFNISIEKENVWYLKPVDDREVIRKHALGNFRELLQASAHSPAMLTYLDNQANQAGQPNENYARELMELHTLGVNGGYTQQDVMELARCLTGWTVKESFWRGEYEFEMDFHDQGNKTVLGRRIEPGGQVEAESVIDRLAEHPSTAAFISKKLARRFYGAAVPAGVVDRAAETFLQSGGDIKSVLHVLLLDGSAALATGLNPKFRRPLEFITASLRMLNAETDCRGGEHGYFSRVLTQLGQPPFAWPTPDGPPDTDEEWMGNLVPRWRYAGRLARNKIDGTTADLENLIDVAEGDLIETFISRITPLLLGSQMPRTQAVELAEALRREGAKDNLRTARIVVAGILASPAFQWR